MTVIKANSATIRQVRDAAKAHFPENTFKFFWDTDDLCLYFKEGADFLKTNVFVSLIQHLIPELSVKFRIIPVESEFWD